MNWDDRFYNRRENMEECAICGQDHEGPVCPDCREEYNAEIQMDR